MQGKPSLLPTPAQLRVGPTAWYGLCRQCRPVRRPGHSGSGPAGAPQLFDSKGAGPGGARPPRAGSADPPSEFPGPNLAPASLPRAVPDWPASGLLRSIGQGQTQVPPQPFLIGLQVFPGPRSWEEPPGRGDGGAGFRPGFRHYRACVHLRPATGRSAQARSG